MAVKKGQAAQPPPPLGVAPTNLGGGDGGNAPIPIIKFDDDKDGQRSRKLATRRDINKRKARPSKVKTGFFSWLTALFVKLGVVFLLVEAFWSCPSSVGRFDYKLNDDRAQCRSLAHAKAHLVPIVSPYVNAANAKLDPYTKPYIDAASPYARKAYKTALPYYRLSNKLARKYYKKNIVPLRKRASKQVHAYADPHVKTARQQYRTHVQPHIVTAQKAVRPYQDIYRRDVAPFLKHTYLSSVAAGTASYKAYIQHVHPALVYSARQIHSFYVHHLDPAVRRAYTLYIRPQANKALQKVFDWKVHALGRDAIKEAKQTAKTAKKEAKLAEKEKIAEAKSSAARAVEDPTLIDRINIAKDKVIGGPLAAADPVASAASDAELEAELQSTGEQLEAWEKGLAGLIDEEYQLVVSRLEEIHSRFEESVQNQSEILTEDVEIEVEGIFAQLAKSFEKLGRKENGAEQTEAGKALVEKQQRKLVRSREKALKSVGNVYLELEAEEAATQRASVEEIDRYIVEAMKAYKKLMHSAKSDKTREKWVEWEQGIIPRSQLFAAEVEKLKTGNKKLTHGIVAVSGDKKGDLQRRIKSLQTSLESLYDTAAAELGSLGAKELSALDRDPTAAGVLESVVESVKQVAEDAHDVVTDSATSFVDAGSDAASVLSSRASEASASASSIVRQGAKSIGVSVEPETPGEHFESIYEAGKTLLVGSSAAPPLASSASSLGEEYYSQASSIARQAAQRAGVHFEPETNGEYVESIVGQIKEEASSVASLAASAASNVMDKIPTDASSVSSVASAVSAGISSSASSAHSAASSLARGAAKAAGVQVEPESPAEYLESAAAAVTDGAASMVEAASSAVHEATRSLASVVGAEVTPEGAGEYVESLVDAASSVIGEAYLQPGRVAASASSLAQEASSSVSSLSSSLSRSGAQVMQAKPPSSPLLSEASHHLSSAGSQASSLLHQATRSIQSALAEEEEQQQPTPESSPFLEHIQRGARILSDEAAEVVEKVQEGVGNVFERVREEL